MNKKETVQQISKSLKLSENQHNVLEEFFKAFPETLVLDFSDGLGKGFQFSNVDKSLAALTARNSMISRLGKSQKMLVTLTVIDFLISAFTHQKFSLNEDLKEGEEELNVAFMDQAIQILKHFRESKEFMQTLSHLMDQTDVEHNIVSGMVQECKEKGIDNIWHPHPATDHPANKAIAEIKEKMSQKEQEKLEKLFKNAAEA